MSEYEKWVFSQLRTPCISYHSVMINGNNPKYLDLRSCTNIVDPDQTLNLLKVYTVSHSFSNTLDISIVSKIIIIKVIECMHANIHTCMHTYMYIFMYGWHAHTQAPTYLPTYIRRACMHARLDVCVVCMNYCV